MKGSSNSLQHLNKTQLSMQSGCSSDMIGITEMKQIHQEPMSDNHARNTPSPSEPDQVREQDKSSRYLQDYVLKLSQKVRDREHMLSTLTAESKKLRDRFEELCDENNLLKDRHASLQEENRINSQQIQTLIEENERYAFKERQNFEDGRSIHRLEAANEQHELMISNLEAELSQKHDQIKQCEQRLEQSIRSYRERHIKERSKIDLLENDLRNIREQLQGANIQLVRRTEEKNSRDQQLEALRERFNSTLINNQMLHKQFESEVAEFQRQVMDLKQQLEKGKDRNEQLELECSQLKFAHQNFKSEYGQMRQEGEMINRKLQEEVESLRNHISSLEQNLMMIKPGKENNRKLQIQRNPRLSRSTTINFQALNPVNLSSDDDTWTKPTKNKAHRIIYDRSNSEAVIEELEYGVQQITKQLESAETHRDRAEKMFKQKADECVKFEEALSKQLEQADRTHSLMITANKRIEDIQKMNEEHVENIQRLTNQVSCDKDLITQLEKAQIDLGNEIETKDTQLNDAKVYINELEQQISSLDSKLKNILSRNQEQISHIEGQKSKIGDLSDTNKTLKLEMAALKSSISTLQSEKSAKENEAERLNETNLNLEKEICMNKCDKEQYEQREKELNIQIEHLENELKQKSSTLEQLSNQSLRLSDIEMQYSIKSSKLLQQTIQLRQELDRMKTGYATMKAENTCLQSTVKRLRGELNAETMALRQERMELERVSHGNSSKLVHDNKQLRDALKYMEEMWKQTNQIDDAKHPSFGIDGSFQESIYNNRPRSEMTADTKLRDMCFYTNQKCHSLTWPSAIKPGRRVVNNDMYHVSPPSMPHCVHANDITPDMDTILMGCLSKDLDEEPTKLGRLETAEAMNGHRAENEITNTIDPGPSQFRFIDDLDFLMHQNGEENSRRYNWWNFR